jgi:redox-sensitive bicupin YhaK (pirin superfamily)
MTAGAGVIHSELPAADIRQQGGRLHGFQLWVNLPARDKMIAPRYQELPAAGIPTAQSPDGLASVRVIAGESLGARAAIETRTPIAYQDWTLQPGARLDLPLPPEYAAAVFVFGGRAEVGTPGIGVADGQLALCSPGATLSLGCAASEGAPARLLLLAGVPLREPVARYGPFVMNTEAEIHAAIVDYQRGRFGQIRR